MARKYYKKKTYTKRTYKTKAEIEIEKIILGVFLLALFLYMTYIKFILPNIEIINLIIKIFVPILAIILWILYYYFYKKRKQQELLKIQNTPDFLLNLESKIKAFKPLKKYTKEELYQTQLSGYLQNEYPDLEIEKTIEYSRPDIIIDNIAIEIKGPTNMSGLKTIPDKINKYLPKRDYLFIVLFDIQVVWYDVVKNKQAYEEKKKEILENTIDSKKDKVFFIEMS